MAKPHPEMFWLPPGVTLQHEDVKVSGGKLGAWFWMEDGYLHGEWITGPWPSVPAARNSAPVLPVHLEQAAAAARQVLGKGSAQ